MVTLCWHSIFGGKSTYRTASHDLKVDANRIAGRSKGIYEPPDEKQVQACIEFVKHCEPTKGANFHSYGLKHVIEKWSKSQGGEPYVSNGACIEAGKRLGLTLKASDDTLNCIIGVSCRSIRKLEKET